MKNPPTLLKFLYEYMRLYETFLGRLVWRIKQGNMLYPVAFAWEYIIYTLESVALTIQIIAITSDRDI